MLYFYCIQIEHFEFIYLHDTTVNDRLSILGAYLNCLTFRMAAYIENKYYNTI